ncbi:MAG: hypothetical protein GWP70_13305 [Proteobacteria bacterium]|nr:hypothetical protein [Pseudomonadota bacterium]
MKTVTKLLSAAAIAAGSMGATTVATADVSYNVGYVSEYYYRGIYQAQSSASAGIDYEEGGFYVGAWSADVGKGLEYDIYAGYGMDIGELSVGVGYTGYYYTDDWDGTYEEVNLSAAYGPVSIGYSIGEHDEDVGTSDYTFLDVSIDLGAGFYGTYGTFGDDADGDYFELGYGTTVAEIDLGVALIFPSDELEISGQDNDAGEGEAIVFSVGKSF